jgi:lipopolysaccharide transport system ATP-binding protein
MEDVTRGGRTILFVSHNMGAIKALCKRAIWIESGRVAGDGAVESIISSYFDDTFANEGDTANEKSGDEFRIEKTLIKNRDGNISSEFRSGDPLTVEIHYSAPGGIDKPNFWIGIVSQFGSLFGANMLFDGHAPQQISGRGVLSCTFKSLPLTPQAYTIRVGVRARDGFTKIAPTQESGYFRIIGSMKDLGFNGEFAEAVSWDSSPILLPYEWRMPDGRMIPVDGVESRKHTVP